MYTLSATSGDCLAPGEGRNAYVPRYLNFLVDADRLACLMNRVIAVGSSGGKQKVIKRKSSCSSTEPESVFCALHFIILLLDGNGSASTSWAGRGVCLEKQNSTSHFSLSSRLLFLLTLQCTTFASDSTEENIRTHFTPFLKCLSVPGLLTTTTTTPRRWRKKTNNFHCNL